MKVGIYKDTSEEYHSLEHIGSTSIKQMAISPAHFYEAWKGPRKESKAFDEGQVVHSVLLEQSLDGFIRRPDGLDARTKEGKAKLQELEATGKKIIAADVYDSLERRLTTFVHSGEAMKSYDKADVETSHYAQDPQTGLYIKARPDILKKGVMADLKTTQSMRQFERQIWNLGYFLQCGFYALVTEITTGEPVYEFRFIAQEKTAPYGVMVFRFDKATVEFAKAKARELLNMAYVCIDTNKFPSYDDVVRQVQVPAWVTSEDFSFDEVG